MCLSECIFIILFIIGIFVFIIGGYLGKYIYYLGHPSPSIDDVPWLYKNSASFFAWDSLFVFWGIFSIIIYIVIIGFFVVLIKGIKRGVCCVVKAPYKGAKYLVNRGKKDPQKDSSKKKKKKKKKETSEDV